MGSGYTGRKIQHGAKPKYEGPTIDAVGFNRDELAALCRYVSGRTSYGKDAPSPDGSALAWLIRNGGDKNALINLGGYGMNGVEQAAYAAVHPSVASLVDGWIAWKRGAQ